MVSSGAEKEKAKKKLSTSPRKVGSTMSPQKSIAAAKLRRMVTYRARKMIYEMHTRTIETLLVSNGLKRVPIEGDGNCFFTAVHAAKPTLSRDSSNLRQQVCDHIQQHSTEYIDFISHEGMSLSKRRDVLTSKKST